jgi:hypothetical protein
MRFAKVLMIVASGSMLFTLLGGCNLNVDPAVVESGLQGIASGWVDCVCDFVTGLVPLGTDAQPFVDLACDVVHRSVDVSVDMRIPDAPVYPN